MMTVRFPSGLYVTYNTASYVSRFDGYSDLYDRKGGNWIVQVNHASGAIIEVTKPCLVGCSKDKDALRYVTENVRSFRDRSDLEQLSLLKKALAEFNAKHRCWKGLR